MTSVYEGDELVAKYEAYRPSYPSEIVSEVLNFLDEQNPSKKRSFMLDVGCGGGQATRQFAPHFEKIVGIDISTSQINMAKKTVGLPNIEFQIGSAYELPVESGSVDLVRAGMAAHYIDLNAFFPECDRALRPGGCAALFSYWPSKVKTRQGKIIDESSDDEGISGLTAKYAKDTFVSDYITNVLRKHYQPIYDRVKQPCKKLVRGIEWEKQLTVDGYMTMLGTVGEYLANKDRFGDIDPLETARSRLEKILGITDDNRAEESSFTMTFEYTIVLFRK